LRSIRPAENSWTGTEGEETTMTTRTPEEVFAHHGQALGAEDLEDIVADYSEDAVLVVQKQVYRGKDGARQVFTQLLSDVPQAQWELDTAFADDVLYLEWKATGGGRTVQDGIDTFIFQDGMIRVQTVVYTVQPL
jgi:ketosteroid isomerase-like protein